jgi:putative aldouronate transport system substrate-binding protein
MKKVLIYFLAVFMASSLLLAGCSTGGAVNTPSTASTTTPAVTTAPASSDAPPSPANTAVTDGSNHFTLYYPETTTPIDLNGSITKEIMKKSGITWDKVEIGNGSDAAQQVNLKLASGSLADAITLSGSSVVWSALIKAQKVIPLDKYFDDPVNYPNLAKIDKRILDYWRASDGHIYFVPNQYEPVLEEPSEWQCNGQGLYVRQDLLKAAGMTNDQIHSLSGFETFLGKLKGMTDSKGRKIIPLAIGEENFAGLDVILSMFGVTFGWNEMQDGTVVQDYQTAGFKQAWQWLNKMYTEGLLDQETPYQKKDLYLEKCNSIRYGALLTDNWDAPNTFVLKEHGISESITYADLKKQGFPEDWYNATALPTNPGVKLAQYANFNPFGGNGTGITAECKNPDLLMKGLDWMQTPEAYILMEYGPESLGNYTMVDGVVQQHDDVFHSDKYWGGTSPMKNVTALGFWWWKNIASEALTHISTLEPPWIATNAVWYQAEQINHEQGTFELISKANRVKPIIGGSVEKYTPVQNDIRLQYYAKMMMAKSDADFETAYNNFLNEMKVRGHDSETIAEFNKQYQEYSNTPAGKITITVSKYLPRNVFSDQPQVIGK